MPPRAHSAPRSATSNTAFLSHQGSAFVSAPGDPSPSSPAAASGLAASVAKPTSSSTAAWTVPRVPACLTQPYFPSLPAHATQTLGQLRGQRSAASAVQVGADISELNINGWNVHLGTTAGYLGFASQRQQRRHGQLRSALHWDISGRDPRPLLRRPDGARGVLQHRPHQSRASACSTSRSAPTDIRSRRRRVTILTLGNNWFIEPSAGFIYSHTNVDTFNASGGPIPAASQGVLDGADRKRDRPSEPARRHHDRDGNMIWQPFASASVFHEFAGNIDDRNDAARRTLRGHRAIAVFPVTFNQTTHEPDRHIWPVFARPRRAGCPHRLARLRPRRLQDGDNIEGWTGNAGIRYQFTPEMIAAVMPIKVKALVPTSRRPTGPASMSADSSARPMAGPTSASSTIPPIRQQSVGRGAMGGVNAGYKYQYANKWVVGVEGDVAAQSAWRKDLRPSTASMPPAFRHRHRSFNPAYLNCRNKTNWMATLAARLGYAWDRTLLYVKAGVAFEDEQVDVSCIFGPTANGQGLSAGVPIPGQFGPCRNQAGVATNGFTRAGQSLWLVPSGSAPSSISATTGRPRPNTTSSTSAATPLSPATAPVLLTPARISQVKIGVNYRFSCGAGGRQVLSGQNSVNHDGRPDGRPFALTGKTVLPWLDKPVRRRIDDLGPIPFGSVPHESIAAIRPDRLCRERGD